MNTELVYATGDTDSQLRNISIAGLEQAHYTVTVLKKKEPEPEDPWEGYMCLKVEKIGDWHMAQGRAWQSWLNSDRFECFRFPWTSGPKTGTRYVGLSYDEKAKAWIPPTYVVLRKA